MTLRTPRPTCHRRSATATAPSSPIRRGARILDASRPQPATARRRSARAHMEEGGKYRARRSLTRWPARVPPSEPRRRVKRKQRVEHYWCVAVHVHGWAAPACATIHSVVFLHAVLSQSHHACCTQIWGVPCFHLPADLACHSIRESGSGWIHACGLDDIVQL